MREFVFTIQYESGVDRLMDLFIEHPDARAASTACFSTEESTWRVDHLVGDEEALDRIDEVYLDEDWCNECLHAANCESHRTYHTFDRTPTHRVVYTRREEIDRCHSISYLAAEHIGDGVLLDAKRRGGEYRWTVLLPDDGEPGALYDAIESRMREGLSLNLEHISDPGPWRRDIPPITELSPEQREVLEAAVERGYYGTPRGTTVTELAVELGVPQSTVQYRLQQAEATIVEQYLDASE